MSTPQLGYYLLCIAGPDNGKRVMLTPGEMLVGRSADCNLLSDDPEVAERFATLNFDGSKLRISGLAPLLPFVDGHPVISATLQGGQQVRFGRSVWQMHDPTAEYSVFGFVNKIGDHISSASGIEKPKDWRPREMFSEVIANHSDEEVEEYFTTGTARTTPTLAAIDTSWPKPWVFIRVLMASLVVYGIFVYAWGTFHNANLIPGLIMMGSLAIPFSLLIFFFEVNAPRNISLYQVIKLLLLGGVVSITISLFAFRWTNLSSFLGAASAGIIEETGKCLALLLVVTRTRFRWTLNGLLLGATVGCGFAIFESAGYALRIAANSDSAMMSNIQERGLLALLGGHVLWTALVGAALWRVRGDKPFAKEMFFHPLFLRVFGFCVAMHMVWNWSGLSTLPFYGKYLLLGVVAWMLILGMIQSGLRQIREAQTNGS